VAAQFAAELDELRVRLPRLLAPISKLACEQAAVLLDTLVPRNVVERTIAAKIVFNEVAIGKLALDKFASRKSCAPKCAISECDIHKHSTVKKAPVPFTLFNGAANKNRINITPFHGDIRKIAVAENVVGPGNWFFEARVKLLRFKEHEWRALLGKTRTRAAQFVRKYGGQRTWDQAEESLFGNSLLHENAERVIPVLPKRTAAFEAASCVQGKRFELERSGFKLQQCAARSRGSRFKHRQHCPGNALPATTRVNIHALQFAIRAIHDDGAATDGALLGIPGNGKQHVGLFQRSQVEKMRALGRIKRTLIGIEFSDQFDYFGLVRRFNGDVHVASA
jgi:hypothetical protein